MDLFEKYLQKEKSSHWVRRALTDKSYKAEYERENHKPFDGYVNTDLGTYGDGVIKLAYLELLLDSGVKLTEEKYQWESDKYLVEKVAKHYQIIEKKLIHKNTKDENLPDDYDYEDTPGDNKNRHKYITTAVEAMIGAIYKEEKDLKSIIELLDSWRKF